jgi:hypothetical protein
MDKEDQRHAELHLRPALPFGTDNGGFLRGTGADFVGVLQLAETSVGTCRRLPGFQD